MSLNIFAPLTNPITRECFQALSYNEKAFIMKWTLQPNGYVPFEHVHYYQDEIFHVKKGCIRIVLNGKEQIACAGETLIVPKGTAHVAYNNSDHTLECIVEYRPGLDHLKMMQCFMGLTNDGYLDKKGSIHIPRMAYFLVKMKAKCIARPTSIPRPLFNLALLFFYLRGSLSNWKKLYKKYTN